jgi:O-methyltransferase
VSVVVSDFPAALDADLQQRYLQLLKQALTRTLDKESFATVPPNRRTTAKRIRYGIYVGAQRLLAPINLAIVQTNRPTGETMMGMGALNNLHACLDAIVRDGVPGDVMEAGVWRGGGTIFMRAHLLVHGEKNRRVWVADSFEGLPKPTHAADATDKFWQSEYLAVSEREVRSNFEKYSLLDESVVFLRGFFSVTMPSCPVERLALLRLDGDMYESTYVVLKHLYDRLSPGGFVLVDDFGMVKACDQAIHDFRRDRSVVEPLQMIGYLKGLPIGAYWRKAASSGSCG